jgi:hypothetical protein
VRRREKSPDPSILDVTGPLAGREQDHVDADVVTGTGIAMHQYLCGGGDTREAPFIDREVEFLCGGAAFDLDERDEVAFARDQIDFSGGRAHPAVEDSPALEAKPPPSDSFAAPTRCFGGAAVTRHR